MYNAMPCEVSVPIHETKELLTFPRILGSVHIGRSSKTIVVAHGQILLRAKIETPVIHLPDDDVIVPRDIADEMRRIGMRHTRMVFCHETSEPNACDMEYATGLLLQESISTMPPAEQNADTKGE